MGTGRSSLEMQRTCSSARGLLMRFGPFLSTILIAGTAAGAWYWLQDPSSQSGAAPRSDGRRGVQRDGPVPVTVASVQKETVPVYREGIGNVQALYTVTV